MTNPPNEPIVNDGNTNDQGTPAVNQGHPAWQEILDVIPDSFHSLITPTLEKWDKGVQEKIQGMHKKYDPYEKLIEAEIPFEAVEEGLAFLQALDENPSDLASYLIEQFKLDFVEKSMLEELQKQQQQGIPNPNGADPDDDPLIDLTLDPRFKALEETVNKLANTLTEKEKTDLEREQEAKFESYMDGLHTKHGEFDDIYVTALITSGMDGEKAVKQYFDTINQAAAKIAANSGNENNQEPPVVMGGNGVSGSGTGQTPIELGKIGNSDINKMVAEMIQRSNTG